ncbi:MAG: cysteine desulfurase-like protein [Ilumatobacteraceae bacterium]|jgi:cysteine desulfurase family protein (TIGR01976 family)
MTPAARFPGVRDGWARFDGPAGTQMVDVAIRAMHDWHLGGSNANTGGEFAAAADCDAQLDRARGVVGTLLGADPAGVCFGANMTTMTLALTRAIARTLRPGDRVVGTRLDHDANVSPWRIACEDAGAEHVLAPFDPTDGRLDMDALASLVTPRTRWVAVTGASNLIGTITDLPAIVALARAVGARTFVDAVHLAPHRAVDVAAIGCDVLATSPYKWYGPHAGVMWIEPALLDALPVAKVRPASDAGPRRWETGTPSFEAVAATEAAARYLLEESMAAVEAAEAATFRPLLEGLLATPGVRVHGAPVMRDRTPTVAFTVAGRRPDEVAAALARERIAVWSGHSYAVEAVGQLGLAESGGVVRAGVVRYVSDDDVARLLAAVRTLA